MTYRINSCTIDHIDLKCLLISRGVKVDGAVYKKHKTTSRLNVNPLCCNTMLLSNGTVVQLTDTKFHLRYLSGMLKWDKLRLLKYISELGTPFTLRMDGDDTVLYHENKAIDTVSFPPYSGFYTQKTRSGTPFVGNAVLQGLDWAAFHGLWGCEYGANGLQCQFCFSGGEKRRKLPTNDLTDIISYAIINDGITNVQLTGGSTYDSRTEAEHITGYLQAMNGMTEKLTGEVLLYITPPNDTALIDEYFTLGASRIGCSLEVWDEERAKIITPGKISVTGRDRHLRTMEYISDKYGKGKAFSNFVIGIEDFGTLEQGAVYLSERGIIPTASVWMPMGRPVMGGMTPPNVDYYKRVKELFAMLYDKYGLEPTVSRGLNVCVERDIWLSTM
jgi:hypothetical protein